MRNLLRFRYLIFFVFVTITIQSTAQTAAKANAVALIDSYMFQDVKGGIKKLLDLQNNLNAEFKPRRDEVESMTNKLNELKKQIDQNQNVNAARQKLVDDAVALENTIRRKSEDYDGQIKKRYQTLMSPLQQQIGGHMKTWCSQKNYIALIDVSKDNNGLFLWMNDEEVINLTNELIRYINSVL